jgi:anti-anti-sigma factor
MERPEHVAATTDGSSHGLMVASLIRPDGAVVIRLRGEADLHTAPCLRDVLADAIQGDPSIIVVDLTGVTFVDSMMLGVLLGATREIRPRGSDLRIVVDDPHVRRIFEMTLLDRVLQLYEDLESALEPPARVVR